MSLGLSGRTMRRFALPGLAVAVLSCPAIEQRSSIPPLTTVRDVRRASAEEGRPQAVDLRGVVTYFDAQRGVLYLQDASGGIAVNVGRLEAPVFAGELVQLSGSLDPGRRTPRLVRPHVTVLGQTYDQLPEPKVMSADGLRSRSAESEWVEVHGMVRSDEREDARVRLLLDMGTPVHVEVLNVERVPTAPLVGARVQIRGVSAALSHVREHGPIGDLLVPHVGLVRIEEDPPAARPAAGPGLPLLTTAGQVRRLHREEAQRSYPVRLRATVTFNDPERQVLFVQDETAGIYVEAWRHIHYVGPGDRVEVEGVSAPGAFAPIVDHPRVRIVGTGPLPRARRVEPHELVRGREDSQWVEVEGIVRAVNRRRRNIVIAIAAGGVRFPVEIPDVGEGQVPAGLLTARVRVRGVARSILTQKGQLADIVLHSPSLDALHLLTPPVHDPFAIPPRSIDTLLQFAPDHTWDDPVRIRGVVTYSQPGTLYVRDARGGVRVETGSEPRPAVGDEIDAVGFATPGEYSPVLQDAMVRTLRQGPSPSAEAVSAETTLSGRFDGELVRLDARLMDSVRGRGELQLLVQAGPYLFTALMPGDLPSSPDLRAGSELRLTGIFVLSVSDQRVPQGFKLLLRGADDVSVRRPAPWWTTRRAAWMLLAMAGVVALALTWIVTLRRRVQAQSQVIWRRVKHETELQERQRMARELHDTLEQNLTGISLSLEAARLTLGGVPRTTERHLTRALEQVDASIEEVHRSVWALREEPEGRDLATSLGELGRQLAGCSPTPIEVVTRASGIRRSFAVAVENNLLRIGQEALTNAVKHGKATHIEVVLLYEAHRFLMYVHDDGRGFDANTPPPPGHFGLMGMRERAEAIGAQLEVVSVVSRGTEVRVTLPLQPLALRQAG